MLWLHNKDNGAIWQVDEGSREHYYMKEMNSSVDGRDLYEELSFQQVQNNVDVDPYANFTYDPLVHFSIVKYVSSVTIAADDVNTSLGLAPADATLNTCAVISLTAVVGQATNYRTLTLFDDGSPANSGATYAQITPVNVAQLAFSSGAVAINAGQETVLTNGTPAVNNNDILRFGSIHSGTGLAFPDLVVMATFTRKQ